MDINELMKFDKKGMLEKVLTIHEQFKKVESVPVVNSTRPIRKIIISGMGGSAIAGGFAKACLEHLASREKNSISIEIINDYNYPSNYLDAETTVILISYSGNTEEVLSFAEIAVRSDATVYAVTSGGVLGNMPINIVKIIGGYPPRAAFGYIFSGVWSLIGEILNRRSAADNEIASISRTLESIGRVESNTGLVDGNPLYDLALKLRKRIPVIYAADRLTGIAAYRWKCQINENAKHPCFHSFFPEWNHNEIEGWNSLWENMQPVFLKYNSENSRISLRRNVILDLLSEKFPDPPDVIEVEEDDFILNLFSLAYKGDIVSVYMALAGKIDPTEINNISMLKTRLSQGV